MEGIRGGKRDEEVQLVPDTVESKNLNWTLRKQMWPRQ